MDEPRCQIGKHKIDYMRACKIFALRCMNEGLVQRNQTKWFLYLLDVLDMRIDIFANLESDYGIFNHSGISGLATLRPSS